MQNKTSTSPSTITLVRALGLFTATLLVAGTMIGSGVFKKIVPLAQTGLSEGWILAAWVLAGIITMFGAFNLAGLSSLTEESGGVYEYLRLAFGNFYSFIFGWTDFTIIGTASVAALGFIFAQTINILIPLPNPLQFWAHISIANFIFPFADSGIKILAIAAISILTWVNYRGIKEGGALVNIFTIAKITGILGLIILGIFFAAPVEQATELTTTADSNVQGNIFLSIFFIAMLNVLWAYDGWLDVSFVTGEIKNPKRNVALAIIIGVSIATIIYVLVNYAYMNVLPLNKLAIVDENEIGAAAVAQTLLGSFGKTMIILLIMVSVFGSLNSVLLSHTRVYYRMAQEKLFFPHAANVHPKHRTPYIALAYVMVWSSILVISGTFDILTDMVIFANFLFYGLLALAVLKLKRKGIIKVKVTGYPVVQIILILFSVALITNTFMVHTNQSLVGIGLMLIGLPFYFYFLRKR